MPSTIVRRSSSSARKFGRIAGGDRGDELLPRLGLRHELHLHLEVVLRLVEALDQGLHERVALGLGHAELKAHGRRAPRPPRPEQRLLPPREIGGRDGAGRGHGLEQLPP